MATVLGLGAIKTFLEAHREAFDLEEEVESVVMRLRSSTNCTDQNQGSAALPPFTTNVGVWQRSGQVHWEHSVVCVATLKVSPRSGFSLWVSPAELRWTHNKHQRLFSCGRRLPDVAASLQQGAEQPSDLPPIGIVRFQKWYSCNNRRP